MNKKITILLIVFIALIGALLCFKTVFNKEEGAITFLDYPKNLSTKIETIEVTYIDWACACANWLPTTYLENPSYDTTENASDCIFLEAENNNAKINDIDLVNGANSFRLSGSYYEEQGISRDYKKATSQKPEKAKVFRYTKAELIKK